MSACMGSETGSIRGRLLSAPRRIAPPRPRRASEPRSLGDRRRTCQKLIATALLHPAPHVLHARAIRPPRRHRSAGLARRRPAAHRRPPRQPPGRTPARQPEAPSLTSGRGGDPCARANAMGLAGRLPRPDPRQRPTAASRSCQTPSASARPMRMPPGANAPKNSVACIAAAANLGMAGRLPRIARLLMESDGRARAEA